MGSFGVVVVPPAFNDDFGLTHGISSAIIHLIEKKIVTSVSIMGNLRNNKNIDSLIQTGINSLGIHFNLTTGIPISESGKIHLTDVHGRFFKFNDLIEKIINKKIDFKVVEDEFQAQLDNLVNLGLKINHSDSHKHIHMIYGIRKIFLKVCEKNSISKIRYPIKMIEELFLSQGVEFNILQKIVGNIKNDSIDNFKMTDRFLGNYSVGEVSFEKINKIFLDKDGNSFELMVHPGIVDESLKKISSLTLKREEEYKNLLDPKFINWIEKNNFKLIGFSEL
jgi:predicted glycoside hydrolase/deacetylase ChbG (UPF0249 family)